MKLRPWIGSWSTYTVLGLIGYVVAAFTIGVLGRAIGLGTAARLVTVVVPPVGFVVAVFANRFVLGEERIVFYQASCAAWLVTCVVGWCARMPVAVISDLVIILVAIFLAFGRIGCLHVGCCHGRPARIGLRYEHAHVTLGFPRRWLGRRMFPIQLVESFVSAGLAVACSAVVLRDEPAGTATCVFVIGYALVRFPLELARGDAARPYFKGLSEAQWIAIATTAAAVAYRPTPLACIAAATLLAMVTAVVIVQRARPAFRHPAHLDEIERAVTGLIARCDDSAVWTCAGLKLSVRTLPDGPIDIVCSHPALTHERVEGLVSELFAQSQVVPGRATGLFHVLVDEDCCAPSVS